MPFVLWIGQLCEEFHCLPSEAYAETQRLPAGLLEEIVEARSFARAKSLLDSARDPTKVPNTPIVQLVKDVMQDAAQEDLDAAAADD